MATLVFLGNMRIYAGLLNVNLTPEADCDQTAMGLTHVCSIPHNCNMAHINTKHTHFTKNVCVSDEYLRCLCYSLGDWA
jgi:hypothetical protein